MSSLDRNLFDIFVVNGMPNNVVYGVYKSKDPLPPPTPNGFGKMDTRLHHIILDVAMANPNWIFESTQYSHEQGIDQVKVYSNKGGQGFDRQTEWIGDILLLKGKFYISSRSIERELTRGRYRITSKDDVARKTIAKHLKDTPISDYVAVAQNNVWHLFRSVQDTAKRDLDKVKERLAKNLDNYLATNWQELRGKLGLDDMVLAEVDKFPEVYNKVKEFSIMYTNVKESGATLLLRDGKVHVKYNSGGDIKSMEIDDLPAPMRIRLGMLKVTGDNTVLPNIGVRFSETSFYVYTHEVDYGSDT